MESQRSEVITFLHDLRPSLSSSSKAFDATTALVHRFDETFFGALTKAEQRSLVVQPLLEGNRVDILLSLWHDFSAAEQYSPYKCDKLLYFAREFVRGALPVILQDLCHVDTNSQLHSKLAQCIVSLPDRASNLKGSRRESSFFTSEKYLRFLAVSYYESLQHARDMLSKSVDCTLAFHTLLLSKLQRTGHFTPFMSIVIPWLARAAQRDFIYRRISRRLLDGLAPGSRLSIFAETIRLCSSVKALDCVLNDAVTENEAIRHVVCDQLLVSRPFTDLNEIRKVCHYLSLTPERSAVLADVFLKLLCLWSRKVNIDQRPFDEHVRTAKSALICLCYLDIHQVCVESTRLVTAGLQEHLSIAAEEVRHHGLAAGQLMCNELYGAYNNIPGSSQEEPLKELNFDLPESVMKPYAELLRCPAESNDDAQQLTDDVEALLNLEEDTSEQPLAQPTVDSDDDDGDQIEQRELPPLHYLPDAMSGLLERNDPFKFDCALNSLVLLLRREASGLRDIAEELTDILFTLENLFATQDFDAMRNEAMTRVCVCHPDLVAPLLARKFYGRGFNQRQRMDALTVLRAAAERLSGVDADADTSESPAAVSSVITPPTPTDDWYTVVQARIERNTKRRSANKTKKDKPSPNRYAAVCSHFFYPLLPSRQRDNPDGTLNLHDRDHALLAQLLSTLATALHCAETAAELPRMADEMYLLCLQLRFHGEVAVRQAVHYALCLTTAALPASLIDTEPYISICIELHEWMLMLLKRETNEQCLTLAAQLQIIMKGKQDEIEHAVTGASVPKIQVLSTT